MTKVNYQFKFFAQKKVVVEKDGQKKEITFRKILLNKCQKEFEKEKSVEKRIHEKLEELSSKGLSVSCLFKFDNHFNLFLVTIHFVWLFLSVAYCSWSRLRLKA